MKTMYAYQTKPLDGLAIGTVRPFDEADFNRLKAMGAVREATEEELKAAPDYLNKMATAPLNKDIGAQRNEHGDTAEMAEMRNRFDAAWTQRGDELDRANAEVERLTGEVSTLTVAATQHHDEVTRLGELIATKDGEIQALKASIKPAPLKAEHHGGGKFNITQGESLVLSGLSKADADAFNALSDEDKKAFIAKPTQPETPAEQGSGQ